MTATVERLNALESATAPAPWGEEFFYDVPDDAFAFLVGLVGAWPALRTEVGTLEAKLAEARRQIARWEEERPRLIARTTAAETAAEAIARNADRRIAELRKALEVAQERIAELTGRVNNLEPATRAAFRVCESLGPHRVGARYPNTAHGTYDGGALDEWRSLC